MKLFRIAFSALCVLALTSAHVSAAVRQRTVTEQSDSHRRRLPAGGPRHRRARAGCAPPGTLKQNVIVENRPARAAISPRNCVAKARRMGTRTRRTASLLVTRRSLPTRATIRCSISLRLASSRRRRMPRSDFHLPVNNLKELQALAKRHEITYATSGVGTTSHLRDLSHQRVVGHEGNASPVPRAGPAGIAVATGETPSRS